MMIDVPGLQNPHTHLREINMLKPLVELALQGGVVMLGPMPNTEKGLVDVTNTRIYRDEVMFYLPPSYHVVPIVQMTEQTAPEMVSLCVASGIMDAKVYPKDRTTKSQNGVLRYTKLLPTIKQAGHMGMRVHFHPEHPSLLFDNRDAEYLFLPIIQMFMEETDAIIVWEHGTDARCIPHWEKWARTGRFYVTLTAHHFLENETTMYGNVTAACKPPYKQEIDRRSLIELVGKDHEWVMAGGDDAPHPKDAKYVVGNCACGAYTAPFLLQLYAHALLDEVGLPKFAKFIAHNAAELYKTRSDKRFRLTTTPFVIPASYTAGPWEIIPFWTGRTLRYSLSEE